MHLVARTPPAWADAGQRISLALWDGARPGAGTGAHPHPHPDRRFRLDLHRHLWDARRAGELRARAGGPRARRPRRGPPDVDAAARARLRRGPLGGRGGDPAAGRGPGLAVPSPYGSVRGRPAGAATCGPRRTTGRPPDRAGPRITGDGAAGRTERRAALPVLPDAATWVLPDLELLRAGLIEADRLHPLVAAALVPGSDRPPGRRPPGTRTGRDRPVVECRGARHRIGLVDGVLAALDHDPAEIRREELLAALTGTPLPCLQAIDEAHRHPDCLADVRERLDHGDTAGALAVVEGLLGPTRCCATARCGTSWRRPRARRVDHGLFRAGPGRARPRTGPTRGAPPYPRDRAPARRHALHADATAAAPRRPGPSPAAAPLRPARPAPADSDPTGDRHMPTAHPVRALAPSVTSPPAVPAPTAQLDVAGDLLALLRDTTTEPRPDTQLEALTLAVAADLPVLLWGEPGIGKTAALTQLAAALDLPLTTVIASVHEPSDFSGLPVVGDDPAEQGVPMAPPDWAVRLVRAGRGLLFLDELSTAPPAVQAALLRLVLERRVGALRLPPGVRIVAAANPRSSAADGWELSPPLANRFVHLQWTHDHEVVVRGLGGTWPRATLPRLDPERLPEAVAFARRAVCGLPHRPPRARPPAAEHRGPPGRRLALAPQLGDDAAPARLRDRRRRLPGGAVAAGPGHGRGRPGARTAGQPGPDGPARTRRRCWPTRRPPSCPSAATCARPCSTGWWPRCAHARSGPAGTRPGRVLVRALETGAPGPGGRPRDHARRAAPRRTGTCRRRSSGSPERCPCPGGRDDAAAARSAVPGRREAGR